MDTAEVKKLSSNKLFMSGLHSRMLLAFGVYGSNQYIFYEGGLKETEAASLTWHHEDWSNH